MKPFVDRIAQRILEQQIPFENLTIIVPSERMIGYLQRALFNADKKPKLLPKLVTIDRWMQSLVQLPVMSKTQLLFELYAIFEKDPIEHELRTFDAFSSWGQLLLNDFDEIDRYLVNPKQLFKNLQDVRELENWSFSDENKKPSPGQQKFIAFWEKLGPYYHALTEKLTSSQFTTKGKVYRTVAENIQLAFEKDEKARFVFAGFNALSESELSIFKQLSTLGRADIIMDSDAFYLHDGFHEAGSFQRTLLERLGVNNLPFVANELRTKTIDVTTVECAQTTGQANVIGSALAKLSATELDETLVLLADESLLGTLLHHLPQSVGKANITLGLPLKNTSLRMWVDLIFRLQEAFQRRGANGIYHKDFLQYVHHPFILGLITAHETKQIRTIETKIVSQNWHFITRNAMNMSPRLEQLNDLLFQPWKEDWLFAVKQIQQINLLLDEWLTEENILEKAIIRTFSEALVALQNTLQQEYPSMSLGTFKNIFNQHWSSDNLAYFGNPLDGLQIMGLLETRGLDFKRLLVLGLNEGTMPPNNPIQTLIPMDLRRFYGLPTPREKQGLFAHHFYRLLHHSETVLITYSAAAENIGSNEPSRFIQQLELELAVINPQFSLKKLFYTLGNEERIEPISIKKTDALLQRLDELLLEGLTFSKLEAFFKCPLNFYYRYVLRIGEEKQVEESLESSTLGTILHEVMEHLFNEFTSHFAEDGTIQRHAKVITVDRLKKMKDDAPLLVDKAFQNHFSSDKSLIATGTNHVSYVIANEIIQKVLSREIQLLQESPEKALFIESLEKSLDVRIEIPVFSDTKSVVLTGIVDRIDTWDGKKRILDYKSGAVETSNVVISVNENESIAQKIIDIKKKSASKNFTLQLLIYAFLFEHNYGTKLDLSGIFSFTSIAQSPFYLETLKELDATDIIKSVLQEMLEELYDMDQPFEHKKDAQYCQYCN